MLEIVKSTIDYYMKNLRAPQVSDVKIDNKALLNEKGSFFVTIYLKWEIRGSAGNVKELKDNAVQELIENTISAISEDSRFPPLTMNEANEIKIRVDKISFREVLKNKKIKDLDPTKQWIITIKKDYSRLAAILPNINPKLFAWEDFIPVLEQKLWEKEFIENDYIIYEIKTDVETDF